jgi:cob(I)alamin adenosyltransferase
MRIYTKTGDKGETALYGGERRSKSDQRIESYGEVDELQAVLGVVMAELKTTSQKWSKDLLNILAEIQTDTFLVCCELARTTTQPERHDPTLPPTALTRLEKTIDTYDAELPPLRNFIMQGGSKAGAALHLARTVCRRAERSIVALQQEEEVRPLLLEYLNRLSDLLFVLARYTNYQTKTPEIAWKSSDIKD